jgi:hypothetical protein
VPATIISRSLYSLDQRNRKERERMAALEFQRVCLDLIPPRGRWDIFVISQF